MKGRQLKCTDCNYITNFPNALQVHRLKEHVTNEVQNKPFKCTVCTYQTSFRSNLQKHQRVHTGERPYICCCCFMRFSFRSNHKRHEQRCLATRNAHCPDPSCRYAPTSFSNSLTHVEVNQTQNQSNHASAFSRIKGHNENKQPSQNPQQYCPSNNLHLSQNQFLLGQPFDQNSINPQTMLELYYNTVPAAKVHILPNFNHQLPVEMPSRPSPPSCGRRDGNDDSIIADHDSVMKIKQEAELKSEVSGCRRQRTISRKQLHPRRSQSECMIDNEKYSSDEDLKPSMSEIASLAHNSSRPTHPACNTSACEGGLNRTQPIQNEESKVNSENVNMNCNHNIDTTKIKIKKEPMDEPLIPDTKIKTEVLASQIQTKSQPMTVSMTSMTPNSELTNTSSSELMELDAGREGATYSLPFTLDAVLSTVSLDRLIDTLVRDGRLYRCQHCKVLFEEYATYVLHMGCHGSINPFSCHFCEAIFDEKFGFLTHFMKCVGK